MSTAEQQILNNGMSPRKLQAMKDYAKILKIQEPRIKPSTVRMKVCKKFGISLVTDSKTDTTS